MDDQKIPATPNAMPMIVGTGENYESLVEHSLNEQEEYRLISDRAHKMEQELKASLHPKVWEATTALIEERGYQADAFARIIFAELQRHLPGLAPALGIVAAHVWEVGPRDIGHCCVDFPQGRCPDTGKDA